MIFIKFPVQYLHVRFDRWLLEMYKRIQSYINRSQNRQLTFLGIKSCSEEANFTFDITFYYVNNLNYLRSI